jgi:hypothetical protein
MSGYTVESLGRERGGQGEEGEEEVLEMVEEVMRWLGGTLDLALHLWLEAPGLAEAEVVDMAEAREDIRW